MTEGDSVKLQRLQAKLRSLQEAYSERIPDRLAAIERHWTAYVSDQSSDGLEKLIGLVHKLAGTATMYGFGEVGQKAYLAEEALLDLQADTRGASLQQSDAALRRLIACRT